MKRKFTSTGVLFMVLVVALASLAVAYTQWSWNLTIDGTVNTGTVGGMFSGAFTDDDDVANDITKDLGDNDDCVDTGNVDADGDGFTSCDPKASGPNAERYGKDVARCDASIVNGDGVVVLTNAYPSYYCTAWFDIENTGTIPLKISEVRVNGIVVVPSVTNPFDLDNLDGDNRNDTGADINIHVSEIALNDVILPGVPVPMDLDMHVKPDAPPNSLDILKFDVAIDLVVFNQ